MVIILIGVGVAAGICASAAAMSTSAGRKATADVLSVLRDPETKRHERALLCLGAAVMFAPIPGPFDEIAGALIVARIVKRVLARKRVAVIPADSNTW